MENELIDSLDKICDSLNKIKISTESITNLIEKLNEVNNVTSSLNSDSILQYFQVFNTVSSSVTYLEKLNKALKGVVNYFSRSISSIGFAQTAINMLSSALSFLAVNPIIAVVGGLGLIVSALALFGDWESEAEKQTRLFTEAQEAKRNELAETTKAINESTASAVESAKNAEIESEVLRSYVDNLNDLSNADGYVKSFEEAQYYVDQINSTLPGTVELTEDGKLKWLENADAIEENIRQLERKAKVEAYYDGYVESLKNETQLRAELTLAQNNYNTELEKKKSLQQEYDALMAASEERTLSIAEVNKLKETFSLLQESDSKLNEYSETLNKAQGAYNANAKGVELYQNAIAALDGSVEASAKLQAEEYLVLEEDGTSTWASIAAASEDCKSRMETAQGEELETVKATSQLVQAEMINKASALGLSYDQMISKLKESGVQMNDMEEEQLKQSYNNWALNSEQLEEIQGLD